MELTGPRSFSPGSPEENEPPDGQGETGYWWPKATGGVPARPRESDWGESGWGPPSSAKGWPTWSPVTDASAQPVPGGPRSSPPGALRRAWRRVVATLAAIGAFIAKFGALLLKVKYLGLVLSMFVSVVAYTIFFGWPFAVGFVLLMFVHEMGHVVELRRQGIRASLPMFIPFLGAFVNMREMPRSAFQEALSGLAGPYFGTAASIVVAFWGHAIGSNFLLQLAGVGFLLNLFNLLPMLPLDGGRAVAALHPAIWFVGLAGLLAFAIYFGSPIALLILVLGGLELWRRWTRRNSPASVAYHSLSATQRLTAGALYLLVIAVAVAGFQLVYVARSL